jgi:hypothetical protein
MTNPNTETRYDGKTLHWKVHMPNLLKEILTNPGTSALVKPLQIVAHTLHELAELAIEIDDPRLHLMMFDLTLYEISDPLQTDKDVIANAREYLVGLCREEAKQRAEIEASLEANKPSGGSSL